MKDMLLCCMLSPCTTYGCILKYSHLHAWLPAQKAGEVIYVPSGWWHAVLNLDLTIAVTQVGDGVSFLAVWQWTWCTGAAVQVAGKINAVDAAHAYRTMSVAPTLSVSGSTPGKAGPR
jgi:hypothetical protein